MALTQPPTRCRRANGLAACLPVALLHGCGYLLGYVLPRLLGFNERVARTVSIETGKRGGGALLGRNSPRPFVRFRGAKLLHNAICFSKLSHGTKVAKHLPPPPGKPSNWPAPAACIPHAGMQSAAMGFALSTHHFRDVLVAVPSAVSIVFMVG